MTCYWSGGSSRCEWWKFDDGCAGLIVLFGTILERLDISSYGSTQNNSCFYSMFSLFCFYLYFLTIRGANHVFHPDTIFYRSICVIWGPAINFRCYACTSFKKIVQQEIKQFICFINFISDINEQRCVFYCNMQHFLCLDAGIKDGSLLKIITFSNNLCESLFKYIDRDQWIVTPPNKDFVSFVKIQSESFVSHQIPVIHSK